MKHSGDILSRRQTGREFIVLLRNSSPSSVCVSQFLVLQSDLHLMTLVPSGLSRRLPISSSQKGSCMRHLDGKSPSYFPPMSIFDPEIYELSGFTCCKYEQKWLRGKCWHHHQLAKQKSRNRLLTFRTSSH